jgi:NitT/TauT family transport system substrate-binding protein
MKPFSTRLKGIFPLFFCLTLVSSLLWHGCSLTTLPSLQTLRVGLNNWPGYAIALYAKDTGLFEDRGLDVELVRFNNQQDNIRATMRGALDASFVPLWEVMQVDPGDDRPAYVMVADVSYGSDGIVAQSALNQVADLKGKTVGAKLGTVSHLILLEALKSNNLEPEDVEIKDLSNDIAVQQLKAGEIDAAVVWEPLLSQAAQDLGGKNNIATQDVDSLVIDGLATRTSFARENQGELTQFMLAWFDAIHAVNTKPEQVFANIALQLDQSPEAFAQDYAGLKKGDRTMNQRMFTGRLAEAKAEIIQLLQADPRHSQVIRDDIDLNAQAIEAALDLWQP